MSTSQTPSPPAPQREPDWKEAGWKHPYVIYIVLTVVLFGFLVLMGYLAVQNEWIPSRGTITR